MLITVYYSPKILPFLSKPRFVLKVFLRVNHFVRFCVGLQSKFQTDGLEIGSLCFQSGVTTILHLQRMFLTSEINLVANFLFI